MRSYLIVSFIIFMLAHDSFAQTQVIVLSTKQFDKNQQIQLADLQGWVFKQGNNDDWANPHFDNKDWKKFKPAQLSAKLADDAGRVEGWFRIKIKLDKSFRDIPVGITRQLWAATDVYVDGLLVHSFGNTGNPYEAFNPVLKYAKPLYLVPEKEYLFAIHVVDYETLFTQRELRLNPHNLLNFISLTGPAFDNSVTSKTKESYVLGTLSISVSVLLLVLFLLLLYLNPNQKIFQLATILNTVVLLAAIGSFYRVFNELNYKAEKVIFLVTNGLFLPVMHALTLLITEWVLKKKISWLTISIVILMPFTSALGHLFNISWPFGFVEAALLGYFVWLVFNSRQKIKKIEWTVVFAMTALTVGSLVWVFLHKYYRDSFYEYENLLKAFVLLSAPILFLVYVALSYKEILAEREAAAKNVIRITEEKKELLEQQNISLEVQVTKRTSELEKSLIDLKATQSQLIQSEKMASLGELTAGIAHEIQNPLNFVNNFSEVSNELLDEMNEELDKGDIEEAKAISADIKQNLEKINHHGKRADAIVKGMLQHSRSSSATKEPTDINKLADEYLRLAYHGLHAKDKSFNATMHTEFDETIGNINIIPQDIGRVILNLITNAFYVVDEKKKQIGEGFEPTVSVYTKKVGDTIQVSVKDNGNGIPQKVLDKIFQPFFTTKPTGQGTGLGLSLSYDIVKAHGGELNVETKENEGTTFSIQIPNTK
jgi:two-component system NtrC family sensor kinase